MIVVALLTTWSPISFAEQPGARDTSRPALHVDGAPRFVLGAYGLPDGFSPQDAATLGFNVVRAPADPAFWNAADAAGLSVWYPIGDLLNGSGRGDTARREALVDVVTRFARHPALLLPSTSITLRGTRSRRCADTPVPLTSLPSTSIRSFRTGSDRCTR